MTLTQKPMANAMKLLLTTLLINISSPAYTQQTSYGLATGDGRPLDLIMLEIMQHRRDGIFIEVGAHNGCLQSNTKLLEEQYGWTGVLVEPSPDVFPILCKNRPNSKCFSCALGDFTEDNTYVQGDFDGNLMSSLTNRLNRPKAQTVLVRSLQSILDECQLQHINFFSLDVEGYELNVLKGIDFTKTTFDYLLVEVYTAQYDDIVSYLAGKGYELVKCLSNYNRQNNSNWDGTHNDYLFKRKELSTN